MNYRVLIFDDQTEIRQILWSLFDSRGYEVFTFPDPGLCPLSEAHKCLCLKDQACSDVIISDVEMPFKSGFDFIEEQIRKGCRCNHIALMSGTFTKEHFDKAKSLGIKIFKKPFRLSEMKNWLDQIEKDISPKRKLSNWFLSNIPQDKEE
jgi:DNA-binding NtrC family response regulator